MAFGSPGHSHNGDPGEGANIDTGGIANGAASQEQMFQDNCVTPAKVAVHGTRTEDFANLSVTVEKMSGTMGSIPVTGTQTYDSTAPPGPGPGSIDQVFQGDRVSLTQPKINGGTRQPGVVCNVKRTSSTAGGGSQRVDFWVVSQNGAEIILVFDYVAGIHDAAGSWSWDFCVI